MNFRTITLCLVLATTLALLVPSARVQAADSADFSGLDSMLQKQIGAQFGVSVLIASDDSVLFQAEYGYVDESRSRKVDSRTSFGIASITKSITAIETFRLIEQGKMHLSDSIGEYLDNVPSDKRSITVGELLSHMSGFAENYVCDGITDAEEAMGALMNDTLSFSPGSNFSYSNENYELLALIIEKILKSRYEDIVRTEVLIPAGMTNTFFWDEAAGKSDIAGKPEADRTNPIQRNWGFIGSGGMYSTPSDLYRLWRAVTSYHLISKSSVEEMLEPSYVTTSGIKICHGWFISDSTAGNGQEIWTRGTESWGPNAVLRWFPARNTLIIVCTNSGEMGDKRTTGNRIISDYIVDFLWK